MPAARTESTEGASNTVARVAWGLLLIWIGAALLLRWSWGVGLLGAGAILLAAQAYRRTSGLAVDGFGLVAGMVLAVCGAANVLGVAIEVVPLVCIALGVARRTASERTDAERRGGYLLHEGPTASPRRQRGSPWMT